MAFERVSVEEDAKLVKVRLSSSNYKSIQTKYFCIFPRTDKVMQAIKDLMQI